MGSEVKIAAMACLTVVVLFLGAMQACIVTQEKQAEVLIQMGKQGLCARPGTTGEGTTISVYYERCAQKIEVGSDLMPK